MLSAIIFSHGAKPNIPTPTGTKCSVNERIKSSMPSSKAITFKAGGYDRCAVVVVPKEAKTPTPVLFVAHGSGGNAMDFPKMHDSDDNVWSDIATKHGFAVVGVEALQFSSSPPGPSPGPPGPVPEDCVECFVEAGCRKAADCDTCCQSNLQKCAPTCAKKDHARFSDVEASVCGANSTTHAFAYDGTVDGVWEGPGFGEGPELGRWMGGQWLIPEVQNDTTGIVCDFESNPDLLYLSAAIDQLGKFGESEGAGATLDTSKLFFTGCSMGSALTVWAAQCFHKQQPAHVTAFASQSTGLKVKGDGINLPGDNYDPDYRWGECPACKYFPAPVVKTSGLKACITDQTGDDNFYPSSKALDKAWKAAGMKSEANYYSGHHCQTHSFEELATCMDDGTGRLFAGNAAPSLVEAPAAAAA